MLCKQQTQNLRSLKQQYFISDSGHVFIMLPIGFTLVHCPPVTQADKMATVGNTTRHHDRGRERTTPEIFHVPSWAKDSHTAVTSFCVSCQCISASCLGEEMGFLKQPPGLPSKGATCNYNTVNFQAKETKILEKKSTLLFVFYLFIYFFFFWPCCTAYGILVPQPGIEPGPQQ